MSNAAKLPYRIYDARGNLKARTATPTDAAAVAAVVGNLAKVVVGRGKGRTLWIERVDGRAAESYDAAAEVMMEREES